MHAIAIAGEAVRLNGQEIEFRREGATVLSNQVRSESKMSGGGTVTGGSGRVDVKTTVTTKQNLLVRLDDNGTERRISMQDAEIVCREGSRLDLIHTVLPSGALHHTHIRNADTDDRRVLKDAAVPVSLAVTSKLPRSALGWVGFVILFVFCIQVGIAVTDGLGSWALGFLLTCVVSYAVRATVNWGYFVNSSVPWTAAS